MRQATLFTIRFAVLSAAVGICVLLACEALSAGDQQELLMAVQAAIVLGCVLAGLVAGYYAPRR